MFYPIIMLTLNCHCNVIIHYINITLHIINVVAGRGGANILQSHVFCVKSEDYLSDKCGAAESTISPCEM